MGEVVLISSTEDALALAKDWQREAQRESERADTMAMLYEAYRLQLLVAEREIQRLRELIG